MRHSHGPDRTADLRGPDSMANDQGIGLSPEEAREHVAGASCQLIRPGAGPVELVGYLASCVR